VRMRACSRVCVCLRLKKSHLRKKAFRYGTRIGAMSALLLCLSAAIAPLCLGLRVRDPPPDFYACEEEGEAVSRSCSLTEGVPDYTMDALLKSGYRRMQALASAGRRPLALHVGADGLNNGANWTDVHLYTRVLRNAGMPAGGLRLAFVEPIAEKSTWFWDHVKKLPVDPDQVSLVTAMIGGSCAEPTRKMYRLSPRVLVDFDINIDTTLGWVSTNPKHPLNVIKFWAEANMPMTCANKTGDCKQNFKRFAEAPNITAYIEEIRIPCQTLEGLLEETLGARVEDLAMLVVDAEGMDEQIILQLVGSSAFKPGFIMWEKEWRHEGPLAAELRRKGYRVGWKVGSNTTRGADTANNIAVLP